MTYCQSRLLTRGNAQAQEAVTLQCMCWTCPECCELRRKKLIAEAIVGSPNKFITLTHRASEATTPAKAALALAHAWRRCRRALMKKYKWQALPFLAVFERTKAGWPHLHIMARCGFIPQADLSSFMSEAIDSPIVSIEAVASSKQVAAYCAKYCGKDPHKFDGCKRYWRSQDWKLEGKQIALDRPLIRTRWDRQEMYLAEWCAMWRAFGWTVKQPRKDYAHAVRAPNPP